MAIDFLSQEDVLRIHRDQIERFGGSLGVRDQGLLESALAMPRAGFGRQYLHGDLEEMGAAYLFHLVKNHSFIDGNKRAGLAACLIFLEINGVSIEASSGELVDLTLGVAEGRIPKSAVAEFLRGHAER